MEKTKDPRSLALSCAVNGAGLGSLPCEVCQAKTRRWRPAVAVTDGPALARRLR